MQAKPGLNYAMQHLNIHQSEMSLNIITKQTESQHNYVLYRSNKLYHL